MAEQQQQQGSKKPRTQGFRFSCVGVVEELRELLSAKTKQPWRRVASVAFMGGTAELAVDENQFKALKRGQTIAADGRVKLDGAFTAYVVDDYEVIG